MLKYANILVNRLLVETTVIAQFTAVDWLDLALTAMDRAGMSALNQGKLCDFVMLIMPELLDVGDEDFILTVAGKSFRCDCGANVFRKLRSDPMRVVCNGCGTRWRGEP